MTRRTSLTVIVAALLLAAVTADTMAKEPAASLPDIEKQKIVALIDHIQGLSDAKFIRNGKNYDSKTAAKFLRGKWDAQKKRVGSARDFISVVASKSDTSGKPYTLLIDGKEVPTADYLTQQLQKIETTTAEAKPKPAS